jgi:DNA-directed RNA polymerase specialized sigma subunit
MILSKDYIELDEASVRELVVRIRKGCIYSRNLLITNNISMIMFFINAKLRSDSFNYVGFDDRYDIANEIMPDILKAIETYDPDKGAVSTRIGSIVRFKMATLKGKIRIALEKYNNYLGMHWLRPASPGPDKIMIRKEYKISRKEAIEKALSNITLREQWIVKSYFFRRKTLQAIADKEGGSVQGIQQLLQRILKRMRRDVEHYAVDLGR